MAYYIESRYIDIYTLVDFSDLDNFDPVPVSAEPAGQNNSSESTNDPPQDSSAGIFQTISEKVSVAESTAAAVAAPIFKTLSPAEQMARYTSYIQSKYDAMTGAELIKILLNPFIMSLGYQYDFDELRNNLTNTEVSINKLPVYNILQSQKKEESDKQFSQDLSEINKRRELEKKLQKENELKSQLNKRISYHQRY